MQAMKSLVFNCRALTMACRSRTSMFSTTSQNNSGTNTDVQRLVESLIKFRAGPVTFAEYMKIALESPMGGYYGDATQKGEVESMIGSKGDFITSPEISQLFGEMVGLWCVTVWQQLGSPASLRLIELGPGKGTLMSDILRATSSKGSTFNAFRDALHNGQGAGVHLVEVSESLQKKQEKALSSFSIGNGKQGEDSNIRWYRSLKDLPDDGMPSIYLAHEFLDAMPVHLFVNDATYGWSEILVDITEGEKSGEAKLEMRRSRGKTPAVQMYLEPRLKSLPEEITKSIKEVEISPSMLEHVLQIANNLVHNPGGGAALFMDYGYLKLPGRFTTRAICDHKILNDVLDMPGRADVTADVDFGAIGWAISNASWEEPLCPRLHGPVSQKDFLKALGIDYRLQNLLKNPKISKQQAERLILGYQRLTSTGETKVEGSEKGFMGMGDVYKTMALTVFPSGAAQSPVGFEISE